MKSLRLHIFILVVASSYGLGESEAVAVAKIDCGDGGLVELVRKGDSVEYQVYLEGKPLLETFTCAIRVGRNDADADQSTPIQHKIPDKMCIFLAVDHFFQQMMLPP